MRKGHRRGVVVNCIGGPKNGTWLEIKSTVSVLKFKSGACYRLVGCGEGVTYYAFDVWSVDPVNRYPNPFKRVDNVCRKCKGVGWALNDEYKRKSCGPCHGTGVRQTHIDEIVQIIEEEVFVL